MIVIFAAGLRRRTVRHSSYVQYPYALATSASPPRDAAGRYYVRNATSSVASGGVMTMTPATWLRALRSWRHHHAAAAQTPTVQRSSASRAELDPLLVQLQYQLQYISIIRAPPWCLNFGHLVPKPDFPHHPTPHHSTEYSTAVSCNIADYSTVLYRLAQTKTRTQCTLAAVVHTIKQCSVDVGGISGERFYLAVVVGTHELVKMLRLGADLVFVLGEHLATLVNS